MSGVTPQDWFLSSSETRQQPSHTSGNAVTALVDGQAYMSGLRDELLAVSQDGYIHFVGWRLTPTTRLLGDLPNSPSVREILEGQLNAGVSLRALLWYVPGTVGDFGAGHGAENLEMAQIVDRGGGEVVLDDRLPGGTFASHHQKFVVMGDSSHDVAFVGGIDVAPDRWDRTSHDEPAGRQPELFDAWHDVQAQVEGPAVGQIWDGFTERWNDPRRPNGALFTVGNSSPAPIPASGRPSPQNTGTCHVQVLTTYPCQTRTHGAGDRKFYPFAPDGDHTYEAGLIKAIDAAEFYVYLEDQYLWPCRVVDALARAAARGVSVILLLTNNYDVPGLVPYHNFLRQQCIDLIHAADPARLFTFHLRQAAQGNDDIYVHAKTVIIDDRYAVIGTANINRRSMSTDTEIAVAIVDSTTDDAEMGGRTVPVCRFARDYRMQLWQEHLGSGIADPLNDDGSPRGWPTGPNQPTGRVLVHTVPQPQFCDPAFIPFVLMNPETTCP